MKCYKCGKDKELDKDYGYYCSDCDGRPGIDFDYNEEFEDMLSKLSPTPFLLHGTKEQNWTKIQQEGLVPQENRWEDEKHLPDRITWFGRDPGEIFINKDDYPIVIALPFNWEKFGLQENIPECEYVTDKRILPEEFLGNFNFLEHPKGLQEETAFGKWLEEMENIPP